MVFDHCFFEALGERGLDSLEECKGLEHPNKPDDWERKSWSTWFHDYAFRAPQALQRPSFKPYNATLYPDIVEAPFFDGVYDDIQKIKQNLAKRSARGIGLRIFPYAEVHELYGGLEQDGESDARRAWMGWDMLGWNELKRGMQSNRERMSKQDLLISRR